MAPVVRLFHVQPIRFEQTCRDGGTVELDKPAILSPAVAPRGTSDQPFPRPGLP